jgi:hypothetical protein
MTDGSDAPLLGFEPTEALVKRLTGMRPDLTGQAAHQFLAGVVGGTLVRFAAFMHQHGFDETAIKVAEHTHADIEAFLASQFDGIGDKERLDLAKATLRELIVYLAGRTLVFEGGEASAQNDILIILTRKHTVH